MPRAHVPSPRRLRWDAESRSTRAACHALDDRAVSTASEHDRVAGSAFLTQLRAGIGREVARGAFWAAAELLLTSPLLESIPRRLDRQFGDLDLASAEHIFADALDALIVHWQAGGRPDRPDAYLWGVCWNKAQDEVARRLAVRQLDDNRLASDDPDESGEPEASRETLRREALRVARTALPRIAQERPREALALILDAVEAEVELTNADLAARLGVTAGNARKLRERGFKRLEQALNEIGAHLTLRWAFELEERALDESDDEEDDS